MSFKHVMRLSVRFAPLAVILSLAGCNGKHQPAEVSALAFTSPEDAGSALIEAAKTGDRSKLRAIFGPDADEVLSSGDSVEDTKTVKVFVQKYDEMHRWRAMKDGSETLIVGSDNYPFAIPLRKNADSRWLFDTVAGKDEVRSRRIGRNELAVIDVCAAIADAQEEYFDQSHDGAPARLYASKLISEDGKQNGLYWKSAKGEPDGPLAELATYASQEGYKANRNEPTPFHGYYFRMLDSQTSNAPGGAKEYAVNGKWAGGFAVLAFPADYGNSGVMTFIINQDGVLLQKNLGKATKEAAAAIAKFDPDPTWQIVSF